MNNWDKYRHIQAFRVESHTDDSLLLLTFTTINANGDKRKLRLTVETAYAQELVAMLRWTTGMRL